MVAVLFFGQLLPISTSTRNMLVSLCIAVVILFALPRLAIASQMVWWLLFAAAAFLSSFVVQSGLPLLLISLIIGASAAAIRMRWERTFLLAIVLFSLVHAIAVIMFYRDVALRDSMVLRFGLQDSFPGDFRSGITMHYTTAAIFISAGLVVAAILLLSKQVKRRLVWVLGISALFLGLLLTTKRAHLAFSLIAIAVAYVLTRPIRSQRMKRALTAGAIGAVLVAVLAPMAAFVPAIANVLDRFYDLADDETFGGRGDLYRVALDMWRRSPILGEGWGTYTEEFNSTEAGASFVRRGFDSMNAHNVYLQLLAEMGIAGLVLFLTAAIWSLRSTVKLAREFSSRGDSLDAAYLTSSLGMQVFFLLYCFTGNPLYDIVPSSIYFFSCAIAWGYALLHRTPEMVVARPSATRSGRP